MPLAASTRPRLGQAVIVVRIIPVPYSEAVVSTPSVITHMLPSSRPKKPRLSALSPARSESELATTAPVSSPMPSTSRTNTPSVHSVERTDLIFVHSEASACTRVVRTTGIGDV